MSKLYTVVIVLYSTIIGRGGQKMRYPGNLAPRVVMSHFFFFFHRSESSSENLISGEPKKKKKTLDVSNRFR